MKPQALDPADSKLWKQFGTASGKDWFIYRLYNLDGALLYVGITWNPFERWSRHRRTKSWWQEVAAVTIARVTGELEVRAAETRAIHEERPRYNIHQARRSDRWRESERSSQSSGLTTRS